MKNSKSLRLLYLLTKIVYWIMISVTAIVVFAGAIMITLDPQLMELGFPANISINEEIIYLENDPSNTVEVELYSDAINIPVKYMDTPTKCYVLLMALLWLTCIIYIARYFKNFMKRVLEGQTFHSDTISILKKAAIGFIILEAIEFITAIVGHLYVQQKFDLGHIGHEFSWSFPSENLVLALTLWALAHIFQKGKELEDEQKLTV